MEQHELAQAIIVERTEERSFDSIIRASALASVEVAIDEKLYDKWVESGQRKTVRDAKPALFKKIIDDCEAESVHYSLITINRTRAIALTPMSYEIFPKSVSRAQVSGFRDVYPHQRDDIDEIKQCFVSNYELNMPVGKCAAQLAHAYHYTKQMGIRLNYNSTPIYFIDHERFDSFATISDCVVVDSGLTVFSGPTTTFCYVK